MRRFDPRRRLIGIPGFSTVAHFLDPRGIQSVQHGSITISGTATSATATMTAAPLNRSMLVGISQNCDLTNGVDVASTFARLVFTDATTITLQRTGAVAATIVAKFMVVTWKPGVLRSMQRGTIDLTNLATGTATITAVTMAKTWLGWLGWQTAQTVENRYIQAYTMLSCALTNATTITVARQSNPGNQTATAGFEIAEWY